MSLLADHNIPFAVALAIMALLAVAQLFGLSDFGGDAEIDLDADIDGDLDAGGFADGLASLIGLGRVPFTIWLAAFLFLFAGLGVGIQQLADGLTGAPFAAWAAAAISGIVTLPVTGLVTRPLEKLIPRDETSAVNVDSLLGRRATISIGTAAHGSPARAQVLDRHGRTHQVMVEPDDAAAVIPADEIVLLVRREGETFYAIEVSPRQLSPAG
ncbi:YqiJ family protein [Altererythrobacter sp. ZODW24]|uniref:YqiJ family protein n=1 Tax=Altererythrobacter sp. ZODW24 TaxID=2185142 RepID=UPI000DF856FC|nr:YqiJ family protein [Altererythrobacter sp. ZODW24]